MARALAALGLVTLLFGCNPDEGELGERCNPLQFTNPCEGQLVCTYPANCGVAFCCPPPQNTNVPMCTFPPDCTGDSCCPPAPTDMAAPPAGPMSNNCLPCAGGADAG
jgi:hypothetical protein